MRVFFTILALLYALSPYDLFPDLAVGWGWLDDLVILWLLWRYFYAGQRRGAYRSGAFRRPFQGDENRWSSGGDTAGSGAETAGRDDPYTVLGLDSGASPEAIKRAYRQLANRYHPDKVEHLGEEFKVLAEKRFKEIEAAYRELTKG